MNFFKSKEEKSSELPAKHARFEDDESTGLLGNTTSQINGKIETYSQPNYFMMLVWFAAGSMFMLASITALPFVMLAPSGFNMYFSLGNLCYLTSVSFYHGPCVYLKTLFCDR